MKSSPLSTTNSLIAITLVLNNQWDSLTKQEQEALNSNLPLSPELREKVLALADG